MNNMEESDIIEDDEDENLDLPSEYSPKSDFSKAEVVKSQVTKCCDIRSKEMKEGYFNHDKLGNKVYIPDSRKEFISGIKALRNLLSPEINRDKKFQEEEKKLKEKEKKSFDTWGIYPKVVNGLNITEDKTKPKYIPNVDQHSPVQYFISKNGQQIPKIDSVIGMFNQNFHNYWNEMVEIYDELFAELNNLIDKINYFKKQTTF